MATTTPYSSAPIPSYDIRCNDFVNQNYQVPINDGFHMGSENPYYTPSLTEVQTPALPLHQPSSSSLYHALTPAAAVPSRVQLANPKPKSKGKQATRNVAQSAKRELLIGKPKRKRGPNKRPPGTAFLNLLDVLPKEVKEALDMNYKGCCESVNTTDASTRQKHVFSNRHCKNLPKHYQELVPNFVCPAFVAFKSNCRGKAGRFDSTYRHCKNCVGLHEINKGRIDVSPVVITRAQYKVIETYRTIREGGNQTTELITEHVDIRATLAEMFKGGLPEWIPAINTEGGSGAITDTAQPPPGASSVPIPVADNPYNHVEQVSLHEPSLLFHPESADEHAGAFTNLFPMINHRGEPNVSDSSHSNIAGSDQLPTMSVSESVPVANYPWNYAEQVSPYERSLFHRENADEFAGEFTNSFPALTHPGEPNVSDTFIAGTDQPCTMSVSESGPVVNYSEQPSFYVPTLNLKDVDDCLLSYLLSTRNRLPFSRPIVP